VVSPEVCASRRALLRGAGVTLAGGAGWLIAGCSGSSVTRTAVEKVPLRTRRADVGLFNRSLDLERQAIAAYTAGIPVLSGADAMAAKQFLSQELQHAGELLALIAAAGGKPIPRAPSYDLGHPRTARDVLALLNTLENRQIAAYVDAIPRLSPGSVRASVASILANDAQHVSILNVALGTPGAPDAFVTGRE
jgi:bacterioferritin (cytochrome b1)